MSIERDQGLVALQRNDTATAIPLLESATQNDPNDYNAYMYLGAAYTQVSRHPEAVQTLTHAVTLQPADAQARYNLGIALEQAGYKEQAVTALEQAVTLKPDYTKAQQEMARILGTGTPQAVVQQTSAMPPANPSGVAPAQPHVLPGYAPAAQPSHAGLYGQQPQHDFSPPAYGAPAPQGTASPMPNNLGGLPPPPTYASPAPVTQAVSTRSDDPPGAKDLLQAIALGLIAAVIGAFLWDKAVVITGKVFSLLAIGIGFGVGFAVKMGAKEEGFIPGVIGAVCTLGSLLFGQYLAFSELVSQIAAREGMELARNLTFMEVLTHTGVISWICIAIGVFYGFKIPCGDD